MNRISLETHYIDIHSHILPCVDDGACDMEMSMQMLRMAYREGIREIILTPHNKPSYRNVSSGTMQTLLSKLQENVEKENIAITLYLGNEIYYRGEIQELLKTGNVCTMAGSSYVLIEFNPMDDYGYIRNGIYRLLAEGYLPILAHAERYEKLNLDSHYVEDLYRMGCYIQLNAGSVIGKAGYKEKKCSRYLLNQKLVHFIATDSHNEKKRAPMLSECANYIEKKYGKEYKEQLLYVNPQAIILNKCIQ